MAPDGGLVWRKGWGLWRLPGSFGAPTFGSRSTADGLGFRGICRSVRVGRPLSGVQWEVRADGFPGFVTTKPNSWKWFWIVGVAGVKLGVANLARPWARPTMRPRL